MSVSADTAMLGLEREAILLRACPVVCADTTYHVARFPCRAHEIRQVLWATKARAIAA